MALRIDKAITEALDAARHGDDVDLSQITIPRLSGGHLVKGQHDDDEDDTTRSFFLSDGSVDRDRDTISAQGWQLAEFKKNGAVLWAHNSSVPPIAKPLNTRVEGKGDSAKLFSDAKFIKSDPMSAALLNLIDEEILRAVSVGFLPLEWVFNEERRGIDFSKQKLAEFSPVPVGSHPGAMVQLAKAKGLDLLPILDWAQKWLDNDELIGKAVADDGEVAAICKALKPFAHKSDAGVIFFDAKDTNVETVTLQTPDPAKTWEAIADAAEKLASKGGSTTKGGKVLSKKNKDKIAKISALALEVLESAKAEEDEDDDDHPKSTTVLTGKGFDYLLGCVDGLDLDDESKSQLTETLTVARDILEPPEAGPVTVEGIKAAVRAEMAQEQGPAPADIKSIVRSVMVAEREAEDQADIRRQTGRLAD